jgi:hypothetical protein
VGRFFRIVRKNDVKPPYRMTGFEEVFVSDFMKGAYDFEPPVKDALREALSIIWKAFCVEHENVSPVDLEARYSLYLLVYPEKKSKRKR